MLTFQIGLHIDDLFTLKYIKNFFKLCPPSPPLRSSGKGTKWRGEIKNNWNNFRLSTNKENLSINSILNFEDKFKTLFLLSSPYDIKNGIRFIKGTNNLVSEGLKIIVIDNLNNESIFSSINECSIAINIERSKIKHCLLTGEIYKNYKFKFAL